MSLLLVFFNARSYRPSIYLGVCFFTISLYGLVQYIMLYSGSVFLISIAEVHLSALYFLSGPMLYWYVRSVVTDNSKLRVNDLWHLLPAVIYLVAAMPYFFLPYSRKVEIAKEIAADPGFLGRFNHTILSEIISNTGVFAGRPLLLLFYTVWSIVIFILYLTQKEKSLTFRSHSFMNKWLALFLGFLTLLASSQLIIMLRTFLGYSSDLFFTLNIFQVLSAAGLTGLLFSPFFFPEVLYGLPRYPESFLVTVPALEKPEHPQMNTDSGHYTLDSAYIDYIAQRIDKCMQEFHPYCQPDFNAASFSVLTGIPSHHISIYLNSVTGQSFSDFRNGYRVEHAKQMMMEGSMKELTIESIGISSGFANRTTFYRVFKNAEGISPGDFAARNAKTI